MPQITQGIGFKYGEAGVGGIKPTAWTLIPGITDIPEIGGAPETIETTSLDNLDYKTYIDGLKDTGGALALAAIDTTELRTAIAAIRTLLDTKEVYFAIEIPAPLNQRMYFKGSVAPLGFGGAAVNGVLTTTVYVTPYTEPKWEAIA